MDMVLLKDLQDHDALPTTKWDIKQPEATGDRPEAIEATADGLDLVLVPGLAFTRCGKRLGRGKGFYDSYFERSAKAGKRPKLLLGLAFKEQVLDDIPVDEHDFVLDKVLSCEGS